MEILIIGSYNTDLTIHTACLPQPGETVTGSDFRVGAGGKGANQAVGAARLGASISFSCMLGGDSYGQQAMEMFEHENIDSSKVFFCKEETSGTALITVDRKGENCIVLSPGANAKFSPEHIDMIGDFSRYSLVLSQLEIPLESVIRAAERCSQAGVPFILNPAPARELPDTLFGMIEVITPNETEAEILTGVTVTDEAGAEKAARILADKGVRNVIITLGSKGAYLYCSGKGRMVGAYKVDAVDTTAAGDIFNAAFCVARSKGQGMAESVDFASAASAICVTRKGALASAPHYDEVIEFLNTNDNKR